MSFYEFAAEHPFLTFALVYLVLAFLEGIFLRLPNRFLRSRNILARGWPPPHLDADGDWKPKDD